MATMTLGAISVCMTVVVLNLHHKSAYRRLPACCRRFLLVHLARLLRVDTADRRAYVAEQLWKRRIGYIVPLCGGRSSAVEANGFQTPKEAAAAIKRQDSSSSSSCFGVTSCFPRCRWCSKSAVSSGSGVTPVHKRSPLSSSRVQTRRRSSFVKQIARPAATTTDNDDNDDTEWKEVAQVVDRLFFWIILILMTLSTVSILLYPMYSGVEKPIHHRIA